MLVWIIICMYIHVHCIILLQNTSCHIIQYAAGFYVCTAVHACLSSIAEHALIIIYNYIHRVVHADCLHVYRHIYWNMFYSMEPTQLRDCMQSISTFTCMMLIIPFLFQWFSTSVIRSAAKSCHHWSNIWNIVESSDQ